MNAERLWTPPPERVKRSNMTAFMRFVRERYGVATDDHETLWRWSVERREEFWPAVWEFCDVRAARRWDEPLVDGGKMPGAQWFAGARLNFAENLLRHAGGAGGRPAIVFWNETGRQRALAWADLYRETARLAGWLRSIGVAPGERVAAYLPNMPETVIAMLAAASVGAMFSSCSPDFGVEGVVDRFGQIEPKVLVTVDGYWYAGKSFETLGRVREIVRRIPSIEHVLIAPNLGDGERGRFETRHTWWDKLPTADGPIDFEQLPFEHPLYILFSSGTTGVPKCIVHGAGGTLLQHLKEHVLHTDLTAGDVLFYFTTCGWMMWNWLVSGLASGCTLVLYDGSPFHPSPEVLFDMADAEGITVFGTSAKYIAAIEKENLEPIRTHKLEKLRTILSTGSPLPPESFDYVYSSVKPDVCLSSISGGTDIVSCFALGNPLLPVYRGELQCRGLGMNVEVFQELDDDTPDAARASSPATPGTRASLPAGGAGFQPASPSPVKWRSLVGEKGELVCTKAFPSMPVGFWNDPDGSRYRRAYFERFPGVWCHGDYAELTDRGTMIIYGRSDATLNPGGVRIGTAEIYRVVEQVPQVLEALAIGQEWKGDVRIVLFVRLAPGAELTDVLRQTVRRRIREGASPRHVPEKIIAVPDIPRTKSGKIVELAVREVVHGREVQNLHALANPQALDHFRIRPELAD